MRDCFYTFGPPPPVWPKDPPLLPGEVALRVFAAWKMHEKVWLALPDARGRTLPRCFRLQWAEPGRRVLCTRGGDWLHVVEKAEEKVEAAESPQASGSDEEGEEGAGTGSEAGGSSDTETTLIMGEVGSRKRRRCA